eukprot:tig00001486_g8927.t1
MDDPDEDAWGLGARAPPSGQLSSGPSSRRRFNRSSRDGPDSFLHDRDAFGIPSPSASLTAAARTRGLGLSAMGSWGSVGLGAGTVSQAAALASLQNERERSLIDNMFGRLVFWNSFATRGVDLEELVAGATGGGGDVLRGHSRWRAIAESIRSPEERVASEGLSELCYALTSRTASLASFPPDLFVPLLASILADDARAGLMDILGARPPRPAPHARAAAPDPTPRHCWRRGR